MSVPLRAAGPAFPDRIRCPHTGAHRPWGFCAPSAFHVPAHKATQTHVLPNSMCISPLVICIRQRAVLASISPLAPFAGSAASRGRAGARDGKMAPIKLARAPLTGEGAPKVRWFTPPPTEGWTEPVIMEWELRGEAWSDAHVHDEYAYVLEGLLFVTCDGETVEATAGDMVKVPAGSIGRYCAPDYARLLGIYAPNPTGAPTTDMAYERLDG